MPEPLVKAVDLHLSFGPAHILRGASFVIHPGDKIALVGPNGAGKTTLFRILAGMQRIDLGDVTFEHEMRIAYLPQVPDIPGETLVRDILASPTALARRFEAEIQDLEAWMADPKAWEEPGSQAKMEHYAELQGRLAEEKAKGKATGSPLLNDVGLPEEALDAPFGTLSGGERSKVLLVKALSAAKDTDLLLLDEPTNHMDIGTVEFIEETLRSTPGAVVVSAHDKYLLDNIATRVFEVDHKQVSSYEGNYSSYLAQREAMQRAIAAKRKRHFHEVKRQLDIIEELKVRNKFDAQVRSRTTRMKHIEAVDEVAPTQRKGFKLFLDTDKPPRESIRMEGVSKSFGDRLLWSHVDIEIEGCDKIGVVGPNGCGKSTLLQVILGRIKPDSGTIKRAPGVTLGYFDQHHESLQSGRQLIEEARSLREPPPSDEWSRGLLGRFHFGGDHVFKRVSELSGGERARLALAKFIVGKQNTLILDEPTNHLDLESQEIVTSALREYDGTTVIASHNRSFLDETTTKTMVIAHRRVHIFPGNYSTASATKQFKDFVGTGVQARFKVRKAFRDWEKGSRYHVGDTLEVTGLETQAFRRLLRWAEAEGYLDPV